jgi:hypothetical protein
MYKLARPNPTWPQRCIHTKFFGPIRLLANLERAPLKPKHVLFYLITIRAIFMLFI